MCKKLHNLLEMNFKSHHKMQWFLYVQIDFLPHRDFLVGVQATAGAPMPSQPVVPGKVSKTAKAPTATARQPHGHSFT